MSPWRLRPLSTYDWDWEGAERGFRQAIKLSPNHAEAHGKHAIFLANMGRHEEARWEVRLAQELDPLSSLMCQNLGMVLCLAREYDQAIDALLKTIEMDENHGLARSTLGLVYAETGMCDKTIEQFEKVLVLSGEASVKALIGYAYAASKRTDEAVELAKAASALPAVQPFWIVESTPEWVRRIGRSSGWNERTRPGARTWWD